MQAAKLGRCPMRFCRAVYTTHNSRVIRFPGRNRHGHMVEAREGGNTDSENESAHLFRRRYSYYGLRAIHMHTHTADRLGGNRSMWGEGA